jgi:hypothetical protein
MRQSVLVVLIALLLVGVVGVEAPAVPGIGGMDSCTAAMVGHAVAVFNWDQCRAQDPQPLCLGEYTVMYYAMLEVLRWCYFVEV